MGSKSYKFRVLRFDLVDQQETLVCLLFEFNFLDVFVGFLIDAKAFQFGLNFSKDGLKCRLLHAGLFKRSLHFLKLFVESHCSCHVFEHLEEAGLASCDQVLHLSLLNDLEL